MAGHEWEDWFEREELIGQISDIRVQNLQVERENVQKRTFTRWINLHLEKCDPPMEVQDLFRDIQDGRILMALLEELSGCKLLHGFKKSSHRIFRLNNIAKVLSFLEERNVKLVSIDASDVADGNSSIVLGLIWNIILFFQIKELTGNIRSQYPSSSSLSSIPTSSDSDASLCSTPGGSEDRRAPASDGRAIKKLLQWVQKRTRKYGVAVKDFGKSWTSGLAFLAVIKAIDPSLVDMRRAMLRTPRENLEEAFRTAHYSLGIARLLEPEDVTINPPDEQSIMTYVSQFLEHFPGIEEPAEEPSQVIERSVSMGRLSAHDSESDMRRNGVHRSRLKERPYPPAHNDRAQPPPPKIFISVLGGDRRGGGRSPASLPSRTRAWASEDSLVDPAPGGDDDVVIAEEEEPTDARRRSGVFTVVGSESPRSSYVESVVGSSETESSPAVDSAVGSPDSWLGSEVMEAATTPERFGESRSDGSLCDSGVAWDVGAPSSADTPEDVGALGEGQEAMATGKPQDRSLPELFIDEGVYSLSSMESTQDRIQECSERDDEAEDPPHAQDLDGASEDAPDQSECVNEGEMDSERVDARRPLRKDPMSDEKQASLGISEVPRQPDSGVGHSLGTEGTNRAQAGFGDKPPAWGICEEPEMEDDVAGSTDTASECAKERVELSGGSADNEGRSHVENESVDERKGLVAFETHTVRQRKESVSEVEMEEFEGLLKEMNEDATESVKAESETGHGALNGHLRVQENAGDEIIDAGAEIDEVVGDDALPEASLTAERPSADVDRASQSHPGPGSTRPVGAQTGSVAGGDAADRGSGNTTGPEREARPGGEDLELTGFSGSHGYDLDLNGAESLSEIHSKSIKCALCRHGGPMAENVPQQTGGIENGHLRSVGDANPHTTEHASTTGSFVSEAIDVGINKSQQKCDDRATSDIGDDVRVPPPGQETRGLHSDQETTTNRTTDLLDGLRDALDDADSSSTDEPSENADLGSPPAEAQTGDHRTGTAGRYEPEQSGDEVVDTFYLTNPDGSSSLLDQLDHMDLFYPDNGVAAFAELPPDRVFSVLALQPAPASSETPPDADLLQEALLDDHGPVGGEAPTTPGEPAEGGGNTPASPTRRQLTGGARREEEEEPWEGSLSPPGGVEFSVEPESRRLLLRADLPPPGAETEEGREDARANTEAMSGAISASGADEGLTVMVLRRRKVTTSTELKDNQKDASTSKVHSNGSDLRRSGGVPDSSSELYVLLLLWMLLYCAWLLPQMDLQALPSMLFNMEH